MVLAMLATGRRKMWAAKRDGEILFQITGPDAEDMVRRVPGATVAYRESVRPTRENGYTPWGPWIDTE